MNYIVSFSGGKDSTAMLLMLLEKGYQVDDIVFCNTGKEFPDLIEHIKKVNDYIKRYNKSITVINPKESFDYIFLDKKRSEKSKYHNLKGYGWPSAIKRWCTTLLKKNPYKNYVKEKYGQNYITYIGLAADEMKRVNKNNDKHNTYPLLDWNMTEKDCLAYCYSKGFDWNGLYKLYRRVSCYLCPLQRKNDWITLNKNFPELYQDAIRLDKKSCYKFSKDKTLKEKMEKWSC